MAFVCMIHVGNCLDGFGFALITPYGVLSTMEDYSIRLMYYDTCMFLLTGVC